MAIGIVVASADRTKLSERETMKDQAKTMTVDYRISHQESVTLSLSCHPKDSRHEFQYSWNLTEHVKTRIAQRGFSYQEVLMAMEYGRMIFKQGMIYHVVTRKSLPDHLDGQLRSRLNNMVVLVSDDGTIITCYKNKNAIKHISRKPKYLLGRNSNEDRQKQAA